MCWAILSYRNFYLVVFSVSQFISVCWGFSRGWEPTTRKVSDVVLLNLLKDYSEFRRTRKAAVYSFDVIRQCLSDFELFVITISRKLENAKKTLCWNDFRIFFCPYGGSI